MRKVLLAAVVAAALPAAARMLPVVPVTSQIGYRSYNDRTSRYFLLAEGDNHSYPHVAQLFLYDALGAQPPRLVFAVTGQDERIWFSAIHDSAILVATEAGGSAATRKYSFSPNLGTSWIHIEELDGQTRFPDGWNGDAGGPDSRGLNASIQFGSRFPFVIGMYGRIYGIGGNGEATLLLQDGSGPESRTRLVGRDREGSRFLVQTNSALVMVDSTGTVTPIGGLDQSHYAVGWITGDGSAYIADLLPHTLSIWRAGQKTVLRTSISFAIPTFDYNGAWIVEQESLLLRHTVANGIETFWATTEDRRIRSLHAGSDGNSLLLLSQIGYNNSELYVALWHAGDPMPTYDSLRLPMQAYGGFIHLNVAGLPGGEPFVFDTGIFGESYIQADRRLSQDIVRGKLISASTTRRRSAGH